MTNPFKTAQIPRVAYDYQDLVAANLLIDFYFNRDLYDWVTIERLEKTFAGLDDIVCKRRDGGFEIVQVKFTVDPSRDDLTLSWDWLVKKGQKTEPFLEKWARTTLLHYDSGNLHDARLITNRRPDHQLENWILDRKLRFDRLPTTHQEELIQLIGSHEAAIKFCGVFSFDMSEPSLKSFETNQRERLTSAGLTTDRWLRLKERIKTWASQKNSPRQNGEIQHADLVQVLKATKLKPINQVFDVPKSYVPPSATFKKGVIDDLHEATSPIVIWGAPGQGKSTFISDVKAQLDAANMPALRHHYYLSAVDITSDRASYSVVASSLLDQLSRIAPALGIDDHTSPHDFPDHLRRASEFFEREGKPLILMIDGLDHVYREHRDVSHLDHLFTRLFPLHPNVRLLIGTQRVADEKLPARLLAECPKEVWRELPALSTEAVEQWLDLIIEAGDVNLVSDSFECSLESVALALRELSGGHPLILTYSLNQLIQRGASIDVAAVRALPSAPEGDIEAYYRRLWATLSPPAKSLLRTLSHAGFNFPDRAGLLSASGLSQVDSGMEDVDFLLADLRGQIAPFHTSLLVFIAVTHGFQTQEAPCLERVEAWLENAAPTYWTWAWLWIIKARRGDPSLLVSKPDYDWVVQALSEGCPPRQIMRILRDGSQYAFDVQDYANAQRLRHMQFRVLNGLEYQIHEHQYLAEVTASQITDSIYFDLMASNLVELENNKLIECAKRAWVSDDADLSEAIRQEFWRRQKAPKQQVGANESIIRHAVKCAVIQERLDVNELEQAAKADRLPAGAAEAALYAAREIGSLNLFKDLVAAKTLMQDISGDVLDLNIIWFCAREHVSVSSVIQGHLPISASLTCASKLIVGAEELAVTSTADLSNLSDEYINHSGSPRLISGFIDAFFLGYLGGLDGKMNAPLKRPDLEGSQWDWSRKTLSVLNALGQTMGGQKDTSLANFYLGLEPIAHQDVYSEDQCRRHYNSFRRSIDHIALVLHAYEYSLTGECSVTDETFGTIKLSSHWNDERWIATYLKLNEAIWSPEMISALVAVRTDRLDRYVSQFDERAAAWLEMAALAGRHTGLDWLVKHLLHRAYRCVVGYGWRKDFFLSEIIDAISHCGVELGQDVKAWIEAIRPAVFAITDYTDGDETRYAVSEFSELIATLDSECLSTQYDRLLEDENWSDAQSLFENRLKSIDLSSPIAAALGATALDQGGPHLLKTLGEEGCGSAKHIAEKMSQRLGRDPAPVERPSSNTTSIGSKVINVFAFEPNGLDALLSEIDKVGYEVDDLATLTAWIDHHEAAGSGRAVLECLCDSMHSEHPPRSLERLGHRLYALAAKIQGKSAAFPWLIRAHMDNHGWAIWEEHKKSLGRLDIVAGQHKAKVHTFINETSKSGRDTNSRDASGPIMGAGKLVYLLARAGERDLALKCTQTMIDTLLEELRDQPLDLSQ